MKNKLFLPLILSLLAVSCSDSKPYYAYIRDNVGVITHTVLNVYRNSKDKSSEYTVICVSVCKHDDSTKDITLNLSDIKGYMNNNPVEPLSFSDGIYTWGDATDTYYYAGGKSNTHLVKRDETKGVFPDCYVCFEKGAIDENVVIKVKDQAINHNASKPTEIDL